MARRHVMTAARRAALRKAQLASARKRKASPNKITKGSTKSSAKSSAKKWSTKKKVAVGLTAGTVALVAAQEVYGRHQFNKMVSPQGYPLTLGGVAQSEWAWHAGRGASRRHFLARNAEVLKMYKTGAIMTPRDLGDYSGYRYARARIRYRRIKGLPAEHGFIHRSGLPFLTPGMHSRIRHQRARNIAAGHRIRLRSI